jgi:hypothetical protein
MRAFRIVKKRHMLTAFSGDGARAYGGRWNFAGIPVVYAAHTRALAALETLAHFGGAERRLQFVTFEIEIPDKLVTRIELSACRATGAGRSPARRRKPWDRTGRRAGARLHSSSRRCMCRRNTACC